MRVFLAWRKSGALPAPNKDHQCQHEKKRKQKISIQPLSQQCISLNTTSLSYNRSSQLCSVHSRNILHRHWISQLSRVILTRPGFSAQRSAQVIVHSWVVPNSPTGSNSRVRAMLQLFGLDILLHHCQLRSARSTFSKVLWKNNYSDAIKHQLITQTQCES